MAFNVFISYSTVDLPVVNQIKGILESNSTEVFVAEYSVGAGQVLSSQIETAIKNCNLFILIWSKNSKASDWVPQEIGIAKASQRQILPIILEPNLQLPGFIADLKHLPIYKSPQESMAWLRNNVFGKAKEKEQNDGLFWLGLGVVVMLLAASKK